MSGTGSAVYRSWRFLLLAIACFSGIAGTGCGSTWKVLRASGPPSGLQGARRLAVVADYSAMKITVGHGFAMRTEAELMADPEDSNRATFPEEKLAMHAAVVGALRTQLTGYSVADGAGETTPDTVTVTVAYDVVQLGVYAAGRGAIRARALFARGGAVTDEIEIIVDAGQFMTKSGDRLVACGEKLGASIASFVMAANR